MIDRRLLLAPVALLASLGLLACGGDDDTAADDGDTPAAVDGTGDGDAGAGDDSTDDDSTDLDLDLGGGEVVIEQGDDSISAGGSLPDDFPGSAVRLPKDFSVLQVQERDSAGSVTWIVLGSVPNAPDIVEFELLGIYGDPDVHTDENGVITMEFQNNGYMVSFTLQENADGDTTTTISATES